MQVGVPFSDPLADGGTIQKANEVALKNGISLRAVLRLVAEARAGGVTVPIVLMGYLNPILAYGQEALAKDAKTAGVDGFIVVDLPPEDARKPGGFLGACDSQGLGLVPLVAPTTAAERLPAIAAVARGFVYCVSVTGVTGARTELPADLSAFVDRVKGAVGSAAPVAVGFGLSTLEHAQAVGKVADGVVMGSAVIKAIESGGVEGMAAFLRSVVPPGRGPRASS